MHGAPGMLRCDNGPEFIATALTRWCAQYGVVLHHIQPGKPNQMPSSSALTGPTE